jgi:hypothetical protein
MSNLGVVKSKERKFIVVAKFRYHVIALYVLPLLSQSGQCLRNPFAKTHEGRGLLTNRTSTNSFRSAKQHIKILLLRRKTVTEYFGLKHSPHPEKMELRNGI